jgi:predicted TIM-barrel fold metal-dependent hydrolase
VFQQQYIDLEIRLKAMNAAGVDVHALSETSPMVYWAPPPFALRLSQVWNDSAAAAHLRYPDRFLGLAMVPMHDTNLALQELDRASNLPGIRGMYMATHVNGKNLDDKAFWPVYARCETLGLPLFLHPINRSPTACAHHLRTSSILRQRNRQGSPGPAAYDAHPLEVSARRGTSLTGR